MWNLSNSDIVATSSVVIALLALGAAFWQAHISRRHNRLSVRPVLEHHQERIPGEHISLSIVNYGIGPALLEKVYFTVSPNSQTLDTNQLLDKIVLDMKPTKGTWESRTFSGRTVLPPGKTTTLIKLELKLTDDANFGIVSKILDETSIHLVYRSMYGELYRCSETLRPAYHSRR